MAEKFFSGIPEGTAERKQPRKPLAVVFHFAILPKILFALSYVAFFPQSIFIKILF